MPTAGAIRRKRRSRLPFIAAAVFFILGFCVVNIQLAARLDSIIGANDTNSIGLPSLSSNNANNDNSTDNKILEHFRQAGVELDDESIKQLPTWSQIESLIGKEPVVLGLDRCEDFRNNVPALRRMLGSSGMFNSGTNLVS